MFQKKPLKEAPSVLVVGAGPIGLWTAVLLSERGISFKILDREAQSGQNDFALTLHPMTLKLLNEVGLLNEVLDVGRRIDTISLFDGSSPQANLDLSQLSTEFPYLVILPQSDLEAIFERKLRNQGVEVSWNHSLVGLESGPDSVTATVEKLVWVSSGYSVASYESEIEGTLELNSRFLIGADGYSSRVRRLLNIPFEEVGQTQLYATIEFETDAEAGNEERITLTKFGKSALWPVSDNRYSGVFQMDSHEFQGIQTLSRVQHMVQIGSRIYPGLPESVAVELIKKGVPSFINSISKVDGSIVARFERRLARAFGEGSIWLCGDAARTTGPIGGHSVNAGFVEAGDLVDSISQVVDGGSLDLLGQYNRKHWTAWKRMFSRERSIFAGDKVSTWISTHREHWAADLPATESELEQLLHQLDLRFARPGEEELASAG